MKTLSSILTCAVMMLFLASCNSFDYEEAEEFVNEIEDGEDFSNEEYAEMLDLCDAAFSEAISTTQDIIGIKDKSEKKDRMEELEDTEFEDMIKLSAIMWAELEWAEGQDELNADNKKRFKEVKKLAEKFRKNYEKIMNQLDRRGSGGVFSFDGDDSSSCWDSVAYPAEEYYYEEPEVMYAEPAVAEEYVYADSVVCDSAAVDYYY